MKKICFVCTGNICRSAMAEFIFKDLIRKYRLEKEYSCASRATYRGADGADMYYLAKAKLDEKKVPYKHHRSTAFNRKDYRDFDRIFIMDEMNRDALKNVVNDEEKKIVFLGEQPIADPWYTRDFETAYQEILKGIENFLRGEGKI